MISNFHSIRTYLIYLIVGLCVLNLLSSCDKNTSESYQPSYSETSPLSNKVYIFGVHPQRNPKKLREVFGPIIDYLNQQLPDVHFIFEASRNFQSFDKKVDQRHFDFMLPNPYGTLRAIDMGYHVFGQMGNQGDLRGLILVRKDSKILSVNDLRGKAISFPGPTALAATIMPKYFLHEHGLNVKDEIQPRYVGSMESSLLNIQMGSVSAGTAYPPAWRMFQQQQPALASELKVIWQTEALPDNSLMARDDMPAELVSRVAETLFNMQKTAAGQAILNDMDLMAFIPANNDTYLPVRIFIKQYESQIGPVDTP